MDQPIDGTIVALERIEARTTDFDWPFLRERGADIASRWAAISAGKPQMFDGRVMLQHRASIRDGVLSAEYFETSYSAFMAWRDLDYPGSGVRNVFAMAALRSADGAWLCGRMADHTARAGMVYFAAGTPDRDDLRDGGVLDLAGSAIRELCEETGLTAAEVAVGSGWIAVVAKGRIACMRPVTIDLAAEEARELMLSRMATQEEPELADIVIIRSLAETESLRMPPFMTRYLAHIEASEGR